MRPQTRPGIDYSAARSSQIRSITAIKWTCPLFVVHVTRWQRHKKRVGYGHVYQGRFKSFPVSSDEYFYQVARYVERNALRAHLCKSAEQWRWSSVWRRESGTAEQQKLLCEWPLPVPSRWVRLV